MDDEVIGAALIELADLANCVSGDFHCLHLNMRGLEFDSLHCMLKKYYEEAADDFDELAEKAMMFGICVPSPNKASERIQYQDCEGCRYDRQSAVTKIDVILKALLNNYMQMFCILNEIKEDVRVYGIANFLQTRIEYWSKECYYFNKARGA